MFWYIIRLFVVWKVWIFLVAFVAQNLLRLREFSWLGLYHAFSPHPYMLWIWANFDGVNYLDIARYGYSYPSFAFFPLFPFLIDAIKAITSIPFLETGILVSNLSFLLTMVMVYKITLLDFDRVIAKRTVLFLVLFPLSFFYQAVYADSLYLLLTTTSFYFVRKSNWFPAGVLGYLAGLCRLVGIFLLPAFLFEWYLAQKKETAQKLFYKFISQKAYFMFLIPLGLITYGLYLQINFGDFLLFQKSMAHWNQSHIVSPAQVVFRYIKILLFSQINIVYFVALVELVSAIAYTLLSLYVLKRVRFSYGVFMLATLILPMFTGTFQSIPRYLLHLFPGFIALALLTPSSKKLFWGMVIVFLILGSIFIALFTRGYFIA